MLGNLLKKPAVLIITGIVGLIATNILTAKATIKYVEEKENIPDDQDTTWQEDVVTFAKCYYPAIGTGILSAGLILCGNKTYAAAQAGLVSAYTLLNTRYAKERDAVLKNIGMEDLLKIKEDIHKPVIEKMKKEPVSQGSILVNIACWKDDVFYETTMEELLNAYINMAEGLSINNKYSLGRFIEDISNEPIEMKSEDFGWNMEYVYDVSGKPWVKMNPIYHDEDGQYYIIDFDVEPTVGWQDI